MDNLLAVPKSFWSLPVYTSSQTPRPSKQNQPPPKNEAGFHHPKKPAYSALAPNLHSVQVSASPKIHHSSFCIPHSI